MLEKLTKAFQPKPKISEDEKARQYKLQVRLDTINKLKEVRNLWNYLMDRYPERRQRRAARTEFIKNDKFAEEMISAVIEFHEQQAKGEQKQK